MKRMVICLLALTLLLAGCARNTDFAPETTAAAAVTETSDPRTDDSTVPAMKDAEEDPLEIPADYAPDFAFTTTDREGNEWTEDCFASHKLTILNFWEPWCGPCVGEMPDLQKIGEEYAGKGLLILGIYQTPDMEDEVNQVLIDAGITYPVLHYTSDFDFLQTGYVPTTVFVNQQGKIVVQPFAGSMDYEGWAEMVEANLK